VNPRAGMDDVEKRKFLTLPGLELRPLGRSARSQSLYRPLYPVSIPYLYDYINKLCRAQAKVILNHVNAMLTCLHNDQMINGSFVVAK
jgi:hypothetical protein